ncbi:MAG: DNA repair protein RecN [Clostridia bacterium]|nr:DNA repair protein RecN [Clostridia bacterium]
MLKELHIKNIAVIDEVHIEFSDGFSVLTGETGAGKSILIDSINMALGKRVSHDLIRTGCDKATVNACFEVTNSTILEALSDMGIEAEDGLITISRQLTLDGKSTCRVNGITMPLAVVREATALLIDIHGQSDNRMLLDPHSHLDFLDSFGNLLDSLEEYKASYKEMKTITKEIDGLSSNLEEKQRRLDLLTFQIDEINAAKLKVGEDEELETKRDYLYNMESIVSGAGAAYGALYGGEEYSAYDLLRQAERSLSGISQFLPALSDCAERLDSIIAETEDISSEINSCLSNSDFSMAELDSIEERLDSIGNLKRKYGNTIEEIINYGKTAELEASSIEQSDSKLEELRLRLSDVNTQLGEKANILTQKRLSVAKELEARISAELEELDMPKVRFSITLCDRITDGNITYTNTGKDNVEFLLSTNPGEALKPMSKIASGGELSRIMLAIKTVLSDTDDIDTMIFDEIDTGVSGRAAQKIAEKLSCLGKNRQVFSISHLAQIAGMADNHFLIKKTSTDASTSTSVIALDSDGRVDELARIIGGVTVTDLTRRSALEMLEMAKKIKEQ